MPPGRELPPRHRECSEPRPKSHLRPYAWPPHPHMTQNSVKTDPKQVIPQLTHCRAHEAWPAHESPPRHRRCNESRPKRHFQALFTAPTSPHDAENPRRTDPQQALCPSSLHGPPSEGAMIAATYPTTLQAFGVVEPQASLDFFRL